MTYSAADVRRTWHGRAATTTTAPTDNALADAVRDALPEAEREWLADVWLHAASLVQEGVEQAEAVRRARAGVARSTRDARQAQAAGYECPAGAPADLDLLAAADDSRDPQLRYSRLTATERLQAVCHARPDLTPALVAAADIIEAAVTRREEKNADAARPDLRPVRPRLSPTLVSAAREVAVRVRAAGDLADPGSPALRVQVTRLPDAVRVSDGVDYPVRVRKV